MALVSSLTAASGNVVAVEATLVLSDVRPERKDVPTGILYGVIPTIMHVVCSIQRDAIGRCEEGPITKCIMLV